MSMDKSLLAGSTTMLVLKLLDGQDMYGYQMIEELARRSDHAFALKTGTLYPLLHSLEEKELIISYEKGEYALIIEVCDDYRLREVEHITSPEALLVDCMVQHDCTAKDAIKLLLKDENNTYSKNELYAAHLALKERFGA